MKVSNQLSGLPHSLAQMAHAYVLEGSDQTQLLGQAGALAQTLLCNKPIETSTSSTPMACGQCQSCLLFVAGNHPDYLLASPEKTSIGVDEIRQTSSFLHKTAHLSGNQVVIIDQAERMTDSASNALLKTLEEPSSNSYLLLLTKRKQNLLPTILSRCQFLVLTPLNKEQLKSRFPALADYLLGFANGSESDLARWQEEGKTVTFDEVYQAFLAWLKHKSPATDLVSTVSNDVELHDFVIYLFTRRVRQLMLKAPYAERAVRANQIINHYQTTQVNVVGLNKTLALTALVAELTPLLS